MAQQRAVDVGGDSVSDDDSDCGFGMEAMFQARDPETEIFYFRGISVRNNGEAIDLSDCCCEVQFHYNFANEVRELQCWEVRIRLCDYSIPE
jgi:hypothetical protein